MLCHMSLHNPVSNQFLVRKALRQWQLDASCFYKVNSSQECLWGGGMMMEVISRERSIFVLVSHEWMLMFKVELVLIGATGKACVVDECDDLSCGFACLRF